jgi:plasmid maintenance system killer protein
VKIRNFAHKGLNRFYSEDSAKGVPPDTVDKLRKMLAYLDNMEGPEELRAPNRLEGSYTDRRPQRHLEPERHPESPLDVSHRHRPTRNL